MYINIIELLESISKACMNNLCKDCPFSETYRRKGDDTDIYYCKLAEMPAGWQIDSARNAEVLCDITDFVRYYNMKGEKKDGR